MSKITSLGVLFDASQVAPAAPMEAVPAGWYSVIISDGEVTVNDGGQGRRIALEWSITEGPFKGRKIFDGLNIIHSNPQAQQIAAGHLSAICHAVGVFQVQDVAQLFNKPHQIKVDVEGERWVDGDNNPVEPNTPNAKRYEPKNRFKGAKAGSAPVATTGTAGSPATPPNWAAGAGASAPVSAPPNWAANAAAPATPATPPAAAPATPPVTPPAAAPAGGKPKGKPGPKPKPKPAPVAERMFFVGLEGPKYEAALPESTIAAWLAQGMPADTGICLEGEDGWKTAADYGIGKAPAAAPAPAPAPVTPPPAAVTPPPAAAPAGDVPPWGA